MMRNNQTSFFINHIQRHASNYYRSFDPKQTTVRLVSRQKRRAALLYRFNVSNKGETHSTFVKVFCSISQNGQPHRNAFEKPLLYPKTHPRDRHRFHYAALSAIHEYFTGLDQNRFGAIRVLDYLPRYCAVITEGSRDVKLRQLFWRRNGFYSVIPNNELAAVFQNAGTWLNLYHNMPKEDVNVRYACREDYIEAVVTLNDFLTRTLGDESFFNQSLELIVHKAYQVFPASLPLGLAHGDFAQRNILVGRNARVTVLDTYANWRAPIYQDIGYFLNDLKMVYPQAMSCGFAFVANQLSAYEQIFLQGYFGQETIPYSAIRLYEVLALLDKWSMTIARAHQEASPIKTVRQLISTFKNRYFKRGLRSLLANVAEVTWTVILFVTESAEITNRMELVI